MFYSALTIADSSGKIRQTVFLLLTDILNHGEKYSRVSIGDGKGILRDKGDPLTLKKCSLLPLKLSKQQRIKVSVNGAM